MKNFKNCLQKEIPFCTAECPFHLEILEFIEKMKRGGFKGAFKTYRNAVGFPLIASNLCHEPCKGVCPRRESDSAIELLMLEKACISFAGDRSPTDYNLPLKKKKAAVIGAGISGLACALRLCMKKYEVEIFEASGRIGGYLWKMLDPELFLNDIEEQFKHEKYVLRLNTQVRTAEDLAGYGFDAVYVATGEGGADFGLLSASGSADGIAGSPQEPERVGASCENEKRFCAMIGNAGWFAGGGLIGEQPVYALANGLNMGTVIDNFLKTGNLHNPENLQKTFMQLDPAKLKRMEPVIPEESGGYGEEEAKQEAARCLECQCDFCRSYCDLTDFYSKWPLRIRDEIIATTLPGSADVKATPARRLLSTCNQCGLCKETCPEEIDLGGLILEGRKSMHRQKKAPWVFHDFWLRDMDFANGELASVTQLSGAQGRGALSVKQDNGYAFFPGCQLGASDPALVERAYGYLVSKWPDTGLMLRCCGVPAEWSGDEEKFRREIETIRMLWEDLGKPTLILACPTCEKKFKTYMTEIPVISLYEIIADWGVEGDAFGGAGRSPKSDSADQHENRKVYSVFDACAARHESEMKEAVRTLAEAAGCALEPLPENEAYARCCSFGGQPGVANPEYVDFVVKKRISECDNPYITYCVNCRDVFLDAGKDAVHILDLLFGDGKAPRKLATVSERRENRIQLKRNLLKRYWNIDMEEARKEKSGSVRISGELAEKLNRDRILEEDVIEVLKFCERTGRRVYHPDRETYSGYREIGYTTYWVEYKSAEPETEGCGQTAADPGTQSYELINAYAHRMKIELEAVWNGRKTEQDL